jgi:hypothetical protein
MTALADALAGGGQFVKWTDLGVGHTVTITATEIRQARKFQSNDLDFWDDGTPKMQAVITLATSLRDDPDDDGTRNVSVNLWSGQKQALIKACKDAGVPEPLTGQVMTATWTAGVGTAASPREFTYILGPAPTGVAAALADAPPATPETTPVAPPPAPVAPPAATAPVAGKPLGEQAKDYLLQGLDVPTVATLTGLPGATIAALKNTL